MAILVRIRLPDRSEYRKVVRTRKDNFTLLGDNYLIDWNAAYWTRIHLGFTKIQCLDYEKGIEHPVNYFSEKGEEIPKTKHKAHHIATVIDMLINQIPHFQLIVIILLCIVIAAAGIGAYLAYDAGQKVGALETFFRGYINGSLGVVP